MSKQYYTYIPFKKNIDELENGIQSWIKNINDRNRHADLLEQRIGVQKKILADTNSERFQKDDANRKILEFEAELKGVRVSPNKIPRVIKHKDSGDKLKDLGALDWNSYVLYIVGHCAPGRLTLTETQSIRTSNDPLDAAELVKRMVADGLPQSTQNIKLLACFGGVSHDANQAYAKLLWYELRKHLTTFHLSAYTEPVMLTAFYRETASKTYAGNFKLGSVLDMSKLTPASKLSDKRVDYIACFVCTKKLGDLKCGTCGCSFCADCYDGHNCWLFQLD